MKMWKAGFNANHAKFMPFYLSIYATVFFTLYAGIKFYDVDNDQAILKRTNNPALKYFL